MAARLPSPQLPVPVLLDSLSAQEKARPAEKISKQKAEALFTTGAPERARPGREVGAPVPPGLLPSN
ncbi:MAG: hypothetical protein AMXMBFR56_79600 [Polyangiaceae bacterium]